MNNYNQMNPNQGQMYQHQQQLDQIKNQCRSYMNYHVIGQLSDGSQVDGIIDSMDDEGVTLLVPEEIDAEQTTRQFGYGYDDYGNDYDDYDRPRRRRYRRFRRRRYPYPYLYNVLLYPYFYPPYPYPYPYGGYGGY